MKVIVTSQTLLRGIFTLRLSYLELMEKILFSLCRLETKSNYHFHLVDETVGYKHQEVVLQTALFSLINVTFRVKLFAELPLQSQADW